MVIAGGKELQELLLSFSFFSERLLRQCFLCNKRNNICMILFTIIIHPQDKSVTCWSSRDWRSRLFMIEDTKETFAVLRIGKWIQRAEKKVILSQDIARRKCPSQRNEEEDKSAPLRAVYGRDTWTEDSWLLSKNKETLIAMSWSTDCLRDIFYLDFHFFGKEWKKTRGGG